MKTDEKPVTDPTHDSSLPPEVRALLGVYALFTQVEAAVEAIDFGDDLTDQARHLLIRLERPIRMGELARVTRLLPSTVTAQVDLLENAGLVERQKDPSDRRAWILSLTEKGEALRSDLALRASDLFRRITGFNDAETADFAALTDKARRNILDTLLDGN